MGYGGEIPEEWDGKVIEILWPPLRNSDRAWLTELVERRDGDLLVRLGYSKEAIDEWTALSEAKPNREETATVYRALSSHSRLWDLFKLPLQATTVGVCLEVLWDLRLIDWRGDTLAKVPSPPKRNLEESPVIPCWKKFQDPLSKWAERAISQPAAELLKQWMKQPTTRPGPTR